LITYYFLAVTLTVKGRKEAGGNLRFLALLLDVFPIRLLIPYLCALLLAVYEISSFIFFPLLLFLMLNYKECKSLFLLTKQIMVKPKIVNL
jgi:hypothetical protein